ncbi:hypothetical protein [Deinococcus sp. NW-56]|uniref:hypothetical protein n=1 Tax=Deinococcus sp. NW-56 TaxID=2080419 RepID=UPI000CF38135|nr:hypothetical protein [Deinococcus sp. NW-56]
MSKPNKFADLVAATQQPQAPEPAPASRTPAPAPAPVDAPVPEEMRMLGGRVPDSIFREFQRQKMDAETHLRVRRVTTEDALEALVRMLRDPETQAQWHQMLGEVRRGRRG